MYRAQRDLEPEALRDLASITTTARMKFNTVVDTAQLERMKLHIHNVCIYRNLISQVRGTRESS